jgi:hypothetical protein
VHPALRDYTVRVDVWRNPKLRSAGLANSWTRVSDPVWKMVLHWINEGNLRDFFQIIARRHNADEGRLDFWSGYLDQITWTRLIFSDETVRLKNRNAGIRELIAREEGAYATMYGIKDIDAFMMQIGRYIIVEFSVKGNAAYVYDSKTLKFDRDAESYHGGTEDLRYGFYDDKIELRIVHRPGWQAITQASLEELGIHPDSRSTRKAVVPSSSGSQLQRWPSNPMSTAANQPSPAQSKPVPRTTWNFDDRHPSSIAAPRGAKFTMTELRLFVGKFPSAAVDDKRQGASGGRLWVEDTEQRVALAEKLKDWGFRWSDKRQAHFYPEE